MCLASSQRRPLVQQTLHLNYGFVARRQLHPIHGMVLTACCWSSFAVTKTSKVAEGEIEVLSRGTSCGFEVLTTMLVAGAAHSWCDYRMFAFWLSWILRARSKTSSRSAREKPFGRSPGNPSGIRERRARRLPGSSARRASHGVQLLGATKRVPRKGAWTSVDMRVQTCNELRAKHDQSSCYVRPPVFGTPLVSSRNWVQLGGKPGSGHLAQFRRQRIPDLLWRTEIGREREREIGGERERGKERESGREGEREWL